MVSSSPSNVTVTKFVDGIEIVETIKINIKMPRLAKVKEKPKLREIKIPKKKKARNITERTIHEFIRDSILSLMKMHNWQFIRELTIKPELKFLNCKDRSLQNSFNKRKIRLMTEIA